MNLMLWYKKIFGYEATYKICHSNTKLTTNDLEIDKAFESINQSVIA